MGGWLSVRDTADAGSAAEDFHPPGGRAPSQSWGRGNTRAARLHPVLASRRHCGGSPLGLPDGGGRAGAAELGCGLACATTKPTPPPGPGSLSCPHPRPEVQQCKERATVSGRGKRVGRRAGCALRPGSPGRGDRGAPRQPHSGRTGGRRPSAPATRCSGELLAPRLRLPQPRARPSPRTARPRPAMAPQAGLTLEGPPELRLGLHAQHPSLI